MRVEIIILLVVVAFLLLGGSTVYVGQSEDRVVYSWGIDDAAFTTTHYSCFPSATVGGTNLAKSVCMVPINRTFVLEEFGVVAVDAIDAADEDCELIIETTSLGSDANGTEIATSSIDVGDANPNAGKCGNVTIDGRGDNCFRTLDTNDANTTVGGGGWWAVRFNNGNDAVGPCDGVACLCEQMLSATIHVVGHYE